MHSFPDFSDIDSKGGETTATTTGRLDFDCFKLLDPKSHAFDESIGRRMMRAVYFSSLKGTVDEHSLSRVLLVGLDIDVWITKLSSFRRLIEEPKEGVRRL